MVSRLRVLLLHAPQKGENLAPPLGLAWIAACLLRHGIPTRLVDLQLFNRELPREWLENCGLAGIGFMTPQAPQAYQLGRKLRSVGIPVVMGGPHVTVMPLEAYQEQAADFISIGESENTIVELVEAIEENKPVSSIQGLAIPEEETVFFTPPRPLIKNLDELPFPARQFLPMRSYKLGYMGFDHRQPVASLISSRGCYGRCTFCATNNIFGRKIRYRSAEKVFEEVEEIMQRYRITQLNFSDDTFTLNTRNVLTFCKLVLERNLQIQWACSTRVNNLDKSMLEAMRAAGCIRLGLGIESGSQKILNLIKKGTTVEQNVQALERIRSTGLTAYGYFMVGNSGETWATIRETQDFIRRTQVKASFTFATPYPGTEFYNEVKAKNYVRAKEWDEFVTTGKVPIVRTDEMNYEDIYKAKKLLEETAQEFLN